jgi:hypothetical protein
MKLLSSYKILLFAITSLFFMSGCIPSKLLQEQKAEPYKPEKISGVVIVVPQEKYDQYASKERQDQVWNALTNKMTALLKEQNAVVETVEASGLEIENQPDLKAIQKIHPSHVLRISRAGMLINRVNSSKVPAYIQWVFEFQQADKKQVAQNATPQNRGAKFGYSPILTLHIESQYCHFPLSSDSYRKNCGEELAQFAYDSIVKNGF